MKLIVGLGNPGLEYAKTRHNMGFQAIDRLADRLGVVIDRDRFDGHYALVTDPRFGERFIVLKPQTYMNLSGKSVAQVASFFKIDPADIIVCYDDLDTKPGDIRLREKGSSGGHKGMQSIIDSLSTSDIKRVKVGIGKNPLIPIVDYVLGKPFKDEAPLIDEALDRAAEALEYALFHPFEETMSRYNEPRHG